MCYQVLLKTKSNNCYIMQHLSSICVFCGARGGEKPEYMAAAHELGRVIGQERWRLVYGAGDNGIMGAVSDSAKAGGADIFGVIPEHLIGKETGSSKSANFIVTDDMHSRKKLMFTNADAAVILPGGAGTLDEFFEILTWAQLGLHNRPVILANIKGYWNPLLALIDHVIKEGFADRSLQDLYQCHDTIDQVAATLRSFFNALSE